MKTEDAFNSVYADLSAAESKHNPIKTHHEGYSVILEELDELWDCIKSDDFSGAQGEVVHVAAMAVRFLKDLY